MFPRIVLLTLQLTTALIKELPHHLRVQSAHAHCKIGAKKKKWERISMITSAIKRRLIFGGLSGSLLLSSYRWSVHSPFLVNWVFSVMASSFVEATAKTYQKLIGQWWQAFYLESAEIRGVEGMYKLLHVCGSSGNSPCRSREGCWFLNMVVWRPRLFVLFELQITYCMSHVWIKFSRDYLTIPVHFSTVCVEQGTYYVLR